MSNSWRILASAIFKEKHLPYIFEGIRAHCNNISYRIKNKFWKEVLNTWEFYKSNIENNTNEQTIIPNTVIWISGLIRNNNLLIRR